MNKRFIKLYESWMSRYNHSGFLVGDIVKFKEDALKHEFFKTVASSIADRIKEIINNGCSLRVKNIINNYPSVMGAANTDDAGPDFTVEVCEELAPGMFAASGVQVHPGVLEIIDVYPNLTPVPDKFKRKEKINIKPKEVKDEEGEEVPFYSPKPGTRRSDVHGKMEAGDRSLNNVNVVIPSSPAKGHNDPASYTANYLP